MLPVEKYRPKTLKDVLGQNLFELKQWGRTWNEGKPAFKSAFLYGPPGVGKTSAAYALANDFGWDVIEINASDERSSQMLTKVLGHAVYNDSFQEDYSQPKKGYVLIIVDEADCLYTKGGRRSTKGYDTLSSLIESSRNPVILTVNDEYAVRKMSKYFKENSLMVRFHPIKPYVIKTVVERIAEQENLVIPDIDLLLEGSHGDIRFAIDNIDIPQEVLHKETRTIFDTVHQIFQGKWDGDLSDNDLEEIWRWVKGNIYNFYDDIYGQPVGEWIANTDRLFMYISKQFATQGKHAFTYWKYIISKFKMLPPHTKSAKIVPPKFLLDYRHGYINPKYRDVRIQMYANYTHMSYDKARQLDQRKMTELFEKVHPGMEQARVPYENIQQQIKNMKKLNESIFKLLDVDDEVPQVTVVSSTGKAEVGVQVSVDPAHGVTSPSVPKVEDTKTLSNRKKGQLTLF